MKTGGIVFKSERSIGAEPAATVLEDVSRFGNDGSMTTAKPDWVRLPSGFWVMDFNGSDAVVDVGDIKQDIKTALLWANFDDITSRSLLDLDGGTHSVEIDGSSDITATGWSTPTIYVDAVVAAAIAAVSAWHFIAVTTATAFRVSDFDIGKEASYFDGKMINIVLLEPTLSAGQIKNIYESERWIFRV